MSLFRPLSLVLLGGATLTSPDARAMDADPTPIAVRQPDGATIALRLRGNEHFNWYEAPDGYTVVRTPDQEYVYAVLNEQGRLAPSSVRVGEGGGTIARGLDVPPHLLPSPEVIEQVRATPNELRGDNAPTRPRIEVPAAPDASREPRRLRNLVLLLRFADHADRDLPPRETYETFFNAEGGHETIAPTGSVRDVYLKNSAGRLDLESVVSPWLDLPENERVYAGGNSGATHFNMQKLITEGLDKLKEVEPDFPMEDFDEDGDGEIDAIAFIHSGYGAEFGGDDAAGRSKEERIWSHKWDIFPWEWKGVTVRRYHISSGLWGRTPIQVERADGTVAEVNRPCRIGVVCHETGHFLGLPDLYDTDGGGHRDRGVGSDGQQLGLRRDSVPPAALLRLEQG